jgi:hypothetical protein
MNQKRPYHYVKIKIGLKNEKGLKSKHFTTSDFNFARVSHKHCILRLPELLWQNCIFLRQNYAHQLLFEWLWFFSFLNTCIESYDNNKSNNSTFLQDNFFYKCIYACVLVLVHAYRKFIRWSTLYYATLYFAILQKCSSTLTLCIYFF